MVVFGTTFASEVSMILIRAFINIVWRCTVFLIYIVYLLNKALYIIDAILHRFERTLRFLIYKCDRSGIYKAPPNCIYKDPGKDL